MSTRKVVDIYKLQLTTRSTDVIHKIESVLVSYREDQEKYTQMENTFETLWMYVLRYSISNAQLI